MKIDYNFIIPLFRSFKIPEPVREYMFHPSRKWRFDFAWPSKKIAMEIEGGAWISGRHNRGSGFTNDMIKYNAACELGWRVLRYPPGKIDFEQVERAINAL